MRGDEPSAGELARSRRMRGFLGWLLGVCALFALVALLGWALPAPGAGPPLFGLALLCAGLPPLLLWRFSARLRQRLEDALRTNAQLRASEERLRVLASASARVLWSATPDGALEDSESWRSFTGQTREECAGAGWLAAIHPEDRGRVHAAWASALEAGSTWEVEYRLRQAGAGWAEVQARAAPVRGPDGRVREWVGAATDITERKRAEQERIELLQRERAARAEAESANRLKDEFLATVSHELRTPLTAILGWAKLLSSPKLPPERRAHAAQVIERNALAQKALVEDLLDVSRIISGKLLLDIRRVDLEDVVERALDGVRPAAQAKEIHLARVLEPARGELMGDQNRLQQVVWNLVSNAIKFTPRRGEVTVRLSSDDAHRFLEVWDNGQGIPGEFMPYLFDRFSQANSSGTRVHGGLGLGLAIVRHVVELHGGQVRAESAGLGQGARFVVELPLAPPASAGEERELPAEPVPDLSGLRVLLVDAQTDARELISASLQQLGANVRAAASPAEALSALEGFLPAVLVSDLGAQEAEAGVLLQRARLATRERGRELHAVALTRAVAERDRALQAGFQSHLSKPVDPGELARVVARLTHRL